jgi:pimeloyl-ACP methyl ester carboxylesterase
MSTYVLVHGAWMSAWGWHKVVPLLEAAGHTAVTLDLPAHGEDKTPVSAASLQAYTDKVVAAVDAQSEPVILVGHSMGGTVISQVAEARPNKIKTLVYLTAYLLPNGKSLFQAAQEDGGSKVATILDIQQDQGLAGLQKDGLAAIFFSGCTAQDASEGVAHYAPDPIAPLATPITTSEANYGRVPRIYIHCTADLVISPAYQEAMYTALPCAKVLSIEAGHASAFLSQAEELVGLLTTQL